MIRSLWVDKFLSERIEKKEEDKEVIMKKKKTKAKKNYEKKKRMRGRGLSRVRACLLKSYKINKREERLRKVRK